jgi:hypothetical protein
VQRLVSRFARREIGKSPAPSGGVLFRVLDHELNIHGQTSNERLEARAGKAAGQDFVVFGRRGFIPMQRGNDGTVRERERAWAQAEIVLGWALTRGVHRHGRFGLT